MPITTTCYLLNIKNPFAYPLSPSSISTPTMSDLTLGARTPTIGGHMLNTLRIQSISDHNVSSVQKSDAFKMYPAM